jgi:hypothetical protein
VEKQANRRGEDTHHVVRPRAAEPFANVPPSWTQFRDGIQQILIFPVRPPPFHDRRAQLVRPPISALLIVAAGDECRDVCPRVAERADRETQLCVLFRGPGPALERGVKRADEPVLTLLRGSVLGDVACDWTRNWKMSVTIRPWGFRIVGTDLGSSCWSRTLSQLLGDVHQTPGPIFGSCDRMSVACNLSAYG